MNDSTKTQSVCTCGFLRSNSAVGSKSCPVHKPVVEPASTGEPPQDLGKEYLDSILNPEETQHNHEEVIDGFIGWCISAAAPQPVSGDAPHSPFPWHVEPTRNGQAWLLVDAKGEKVALANCTDNAQQNMECIAKLTKAGNAPKVEEIARKLHLYHCQERRSGAMCPCHIVADGMTEGCHCKEETADIAAILHPYFSPDINIEKKYLTALRWFKLFYDFYQKAIKGKPSAAMSAMSEDSELQELLREADRIR